MKKARIELMSLDTFVEKESSTRILELEDGATEDDLLGQISDLESKTEQVCYDWVWCNQSQSVKSTGTI